MAASYSMTRNPWAWVRVVVLAALAWLIAQVVPYAGASTLDIIVPYALNLGVLFSITVGFLMFKTLTRRTGLDEHIAVELNKIRRVYHLSLHMKKANPSLSDWFGRVRNAIITYLKSFEGQSFGSYEKGNPLFRAVTYGVYTLPALNEPYNPELYEGLLQTTNEVTEARENIRSKKNDYIGGFAWFVVVIISLVFSVMIMAFTPHDLILRDIAAGVIFCLFLVIQLVYEHDRDGGVRERALAKKYLHDLQALESAQTEY